MLQELANFEPSGILMGSRARILLTRRGAHTKIHSGLAFV